MRLGPPRSLRNHEARVKMRKAMEAAVTKNTLKPNGDADQQARESTKTQTPRMQRDSRGGQYLSEIDVACDGWGNLREEVRRACGRK